MRKTAKMIDRIREGESRERERELEPRCLPVADR